MATIYSVYGSGLIHPVYDWKSASTWQGGVIPGAADTVYIRGYRTTNSSGAINPSYFDTPATITVPDTTGFASVGYFYTYTTKSRKIKIDYTGKTGTTFTGCTIDMSYQKWDYSFLNGGTMVGSGYIISPAPIITVSNSSAPTATALAVIIEYGGILQVNNTGVFEILDYITVRDGKLEAIDNATLFHKKVKALSRIVGENYPLSEIYLLGSELRASGTYGTVSKSYTRNGLNFNGGKFAGGSVGDFNGNSYLRFSGAYTGLPYIELWTKITKADGSYNWFFENSAQSSATRLCQLARYSTNKIGFDIFTSLGTYSILSINDYLIGSVVFIKAWYDNTNLYLQIYDENMNILENLSTNIGSKTLIVTCTFLTIGYSSPSTSYYHQGDIWGVKYKSGSTTVLDWKGNSIRESINGVKPYVYGLVNFRKVYFSVDSTLSALDNGYYLYTDGDEVVNPQYSIPGSVVNKAGGSFYNDYTSCFVDFDTEPGELVSPEFLYGYEAGNVSLLLNDATNFKVGDQIAIYEQENTVDPAYPLYYNTQQFAGYPKSLDEGADIVGKNGNTIYLKKRNGITAPILQSTTVDGVATIYVDEQRYKNNDIIVINNKKYTISAIEDSDFLLRDYDFSTLLNLNDWTTDTTQSATLADWTIDNTIGALKANSTGNRHIFIKDIYRKNVKIEAWMSPLSNVTSGTRSVSPYGICYSQDPSMIRHNFNNSLGYDRGFSYVDDNNNRLDLVIPMNNPGLYINSMDLMDIRTATRTLAKYTVEVRNGFVNLYVNDAQYITRFVGDIRSGLVGIMHAGNQYMRTTRFKVYATCQKITLLTADTFNTGDMVYESGLDYRHKPNGKIVKISSIVTDPDAHSDLAYAYQGRNGSNIYPTLKGINANDSTYLYPWYLNGHVGYGADNIPMAAGADKYVVIDLMRQVTFTHVSLSHYRDYLSTGYTILGVQIWGSNDGTTWVQIKSKADDNRLGASYMHLRYYPTGTQTYRYIKLGLSGTSYDTNNYLTGLNVFDFRNGYRIKLNNTSDLAIGDRVAILNNHFMNGQYSDTWYAAISGGTKVDADYVGELKHYYTLTNVSGDYITLDRPFDQGYIDGGEQVIKLNRNVKVLGQNGTSYSRGNFCTNAGYSYVRKYKLVNVEFDKFGQAQWNLNTNTTGLALMSYDHFNAVIVDGISYHSGYSGYTWTCYSYDSNTYVRNSFFANAHGFNFFGDNYSTKQINVISNNIFSNFYGYTRSSYYSPLISYNTFHAAASVGLPIGTPMYQLDGYSPSNPQIIRNFITGSAYGFAATTGKYAGYSTRFWTIKGNLIQSTYGYSLYMFGSPNYSSGFLLNTQDFGQKNVSTGTYIYNFYHGGGIKYTNFDRSGYGSYNRHDDYKISFYAYGNIIKYDNEDFLRVYSSILSSGYSIFGIDFQVYDNEKTYIDLGFNYKQTIEQVSNISTNNALVYRIFKNGEVIYQKYLTKTVNWTDFTSSRYVQGPGRYTAVIEQLSYAGYFSIKNMFGNVTSQSKNIYVYGNNMDVSLMLSEDNFIKQAKDYRETSISSSYNRYIPINKIKGL